MHFDPKAYGPVLGGLVNTDRKRALDAGSPVTGMRDKLGSVTIEDAFGDIRVADRDMASCCIAGVWLLYDFLDESHAISQGVPNASGSFWHGIMHRREGDFANAKYWFRRVGSHPVYAGLVAAAQRLGESASSEAARALTAEGEWDPYQFVDLCQSAVRGKSGAEPLLVSIQQAEWELLFDHCYAAAIGR
jgi:hypothetical protein